MKKTIYLKKDKSGYYIFGIKIALLFSLLSTICFYSSAGKQALITRRHTLSSDIKNIRIQVHQVHIRLLKMKGKKKEIKVQYHKTLSIEEEDSTLIVSEKDFPRSEKYKEGLKKKPVMTVWATRLPVKIGIFEGTVQINQFWKTDLALFVLGKGSINIKNTAGSLHIFQSSGDIGVQSHSGELMIQSEDSRIRLRSCKGQMNISSFKGHLEVNKSNGRLFVQSFKAPLVLKHFTGRLDFRQEKGGVYLKPLVGSVFGYSKEGEVRGVIRANEVDIETQTGRIHLDFPYSRAWVTAETWEGRIFTPLYFNRIKTGGIDRSKGQLRGTKKKGSVSLKSHAGSIRVYQSIN
ncbi:MAG: hypothetical protein OXM55_07915 [Bdellovibrionales bacterium]|nr:hypothetical protein [Bdellovibrionales bacterium]